MGVASQKDCRTFFHVVASAPSSTKLREPFTKLVKRVRMTFASFQLQISWIASSAKRKSAKDMNAGPKKSSPTLMFASGPLRTNRKPKKVPCCLHAARCVDFKKYTICGMTVSAQRSEKAAMRAFAILLFSVLPCIYFLPHYQNGKYSTTWREHRLLSFLNSKIAQRQNAWRTSPSFFRPIPET